MKRTLMIFLLSIGPAIAQEPPPVTPSAKTVTLTEADVKRLVKEALDAEKKKAKEKADEEKRKKEEEAALKKAKGKVVGDDNIFEPYWRKALNFKTDDGAFKVHVGGRWHTDAAFYNTEQGIDNDPNIRAVRDGVNFRRARIRVNGTLYEKIDWLMEYGFEAGVPAFFDIYAQMRDIPYIGNFRVGHFREPFSMDAVTGGNNLAFIERSLIQDAFVPFRNTGLLITDHICDQQVWWAVGAFRSNSNLVGADAGDRNYAVTGRVTANFGYDRQTGTALHIGIAGSHRNLPRLNAAGTPSATGQPRVRLFTRPEIRPNAPRLVNTGFFQADQQQIIGTEFGLGMGPLLIQAEYVGTFIQDAVPNGGGGMIGTAFFHGLYVQASYFLTGEVRPYNRAVGMYGPAKPHENFFCVRNEHGCNTPKGWGAWEVGARYSYVDLTDSGINGGTLEDATFGINWHWNPNCRWMFNYILSWRDVQGTMNDGLTRILAARFQLDF